MWHVMSLLHLLFTIQRPEAKSGQAGPWHNSSPSQSGGPGLVHNSLPDYEQSDRADTESRVHETTTPSVTVRLDQEEQDSIGEHQEEFTNVAGISSLPLLIVPVHCRSSFDGWLHGAPEWEQLQHSLPPPRRCTGVLGPPSYPIPRTFRLATRKSLEASSQLTKSPASLGYCLVISYW